MCGWVYKASAGLMSKGAMKKRWLILADMRLTYYESPLSLEEVKDELSCADITAVAEVISITHTHIASSVSHLLTCNARLTVGGPKERGQGVEIELWKEGVVGYQIRSRVPSLDASHVAKEDHPLLPCD